MKGSINVAQFFGFAVTSLAGTVLHFLYDWLGGAIWIAPFSGVNESTWEHMKLLFWPMFIYAIIESFFFKDRRDFWCVKARGIMLGLILIPVIFYTYNGAIGKSPDWFNIAIFFISAAAAYFYEAKLFNAGKTACRSPKSALVALSTVALLFVLFTFKVPKIGVFMDPLTKEYGIIL